MTKPTTSPPYTPVVATYRPADLSRKLGYIDESRPGSVVRAYLRKKYPDHPPYQPWVLDEDEAADVLAHVPRKT